jgi:hypothetical protein
MPPRKIPYDNILKVYSFFLKNIPGKNVLINGHVEDREAKD